MAVDPQRTGLSERDIEQAITVLKKGSHLLKYGRRGKPKFCAFRLSNDESALVWYSGKKEKQVKLSNVSRIIPGQRTAIFQRYPRPEKDYQSFSLIHTDRSLDLICKDKEEADVWFVALKALIYRNNPNRQRCEISEIVLPVLPDSPQYRTRRNSPSVSPFDPGDTQGIQVHSENNSETRLGKAFADIILYTATTKSSSQAEPVSNSLSSLPSVAPDNTSNARSSTGEAIRVSLSSCISSSSQGSYHEDFDALGDVFIWGEGVGDGMLGGGKHKVGSSLSPKIDALLPKALVSTIILDIHNIACGSRHAVLVTKQGEIFSWGEEAGGRLGHGREADVSQPKLIDTLSGMNVELIACGEHHTCAVTQAGDLYTWGDGTHNFGLLGHGSEAGHWIPKRVCGQMEGIQVSFIACGPWHTAVVTSAGQLFTFGDGSFGTLGHGDNSSTRIPREVEAFRGLRVTRVACGVWHTAAVVEVTEEPSGSGPIDNTSWGRLFTWGDGDKGRLGHGDQDPRLFPECVASLNDQNICQVACGHHLTVALTTFGRVYTMGSPAYGQLGYPAVKGEVPNRVLGKIADSFVEEIACGSYHIAIRTAKPEVYTWGRGGNGQLGHGDNNDKNTPTLVDSLKDKQVKSIKCGSNFTAVICLHKGISGSDDCVCSACRNPFGFRRKRHNCYNCGLVFCKVCSSKKSLKASLAPNMNKPYRVCDDCFTKLKNNAMESGPVVRTPKRKSGSREIQGSILQGQLSRLSSFGSSNPAESRHSRNDIKLELYDSRLVPNMNGKSQLGPFSSSKASISSVVASKKFFSASVPNSKIASRATSPVSGMSTPRTSCDTPDGSKQRNDGLSHEIIYLRAQVEELTRKSQQLQAELDRTSKQLKDVTALAGDEAEKCKSAKEVIMSLTAQLKEVTEKLSEGYTGYIGKDASILNLVTGENNTTSIISPGRESDSENHILSNGTKAQAEEGKLQTERAERVLHAEPGVYITLTSLPDGGNELKRIRFSRKHFTEQQAEKWWAEHGTKICEQHNIRS